MAPLDLVASGGILRRRSLEVIAREAGALMGRAKRSDRRSLADGAPPPPPPSTLGDWYASTTVTAAILVQMQFAAAVGARDVNAALQFADNWGHLYGVYGSPYTMEGACATADPTLRSLKGSIVAGVAQLDRPVVLSAAYAEQLACGLSRLTWRPGEVDGAAQEQLLATVRENRLLPLLASWRLVHATGVPAVPLTPAAQQCVFDLANTLMRQARQAAGNHQPMHASHLYAPAAPHAAND